MSYDDDTLPADSWSSDRRFTRSDGGKKEQLRQEIKAATGKNVEVGKIELSSQLNLKLLKNQLAGKSDEETKRKREQDKISKLKFGPKTQKEREESQLKGINESPTADKLIEQDQQATDLADEEQIAELG